MSVLTEEFQEFPASLASPAQLEHHQRTTSTLTASHLNRTLKTTGVLDLTSTVVLHTSLQSLPVDRGGFGNIHKGTCRRAGTGESIQVAVKCLQIRTGRDEELAKLLKDIAREIRIWSTLKHPNIMPLLGYIIEGPYPALVSVWMTHGSMHRYMSQRKLSGIKSLSMILDIASGLAYMHSRLAIHSDLKSDNVLVSREERAVLTDFGISRMEDLSSGYSTRSSMGSVRWMAVEFFTLQTATDGHPQHTYETDIWGFGMTVYEVLTGGRPYADIPPHLVMWRIANKVLPKKPTISKDPLDAKIENFLWSICEKCWRIDPKARPSMSDIEDEVRKEIDCLE